MKEGATVRRDTIDVHPAAHLIREMTDDEFVSLKEDIRIHGLREPIKLLNGAIVDGRNRQKACDELNIPANYEAIETSDPKAYVLSLNVTRRHLTAFERARMANREATRTRADNQWSTGTGAEALPTQMEAARKYSVSVRTMRDVKKVLEFGDKDLIAAVESGEVSIKGAVRRRRNSEAERKREERANLPSSDGMEIYLCSCADLIERVEPGSVDLVATDPPYSARYLDCWNELAEFAAHALKPGGQLLALSGQTWLPEVIDCLRVDGLSYRWTLSLQYRRGTSYSSFLREMQSDWKPVLIFEKPGERRLGGHYPHDVVIATAPDADSKKRHKWGQDEGAFRDLLGKFAGPGMLVCDPFVGAGTTAVVAHELGCSFIGCDIAEASVATSWDAVSGLSVAA